MLALKQWFHLLPRPQQVHVHIRFGIGFKKNNQFFPIVFQKRTDCSDYGPFK